MPAVNLMVKEAEVEMPEEMIVIMEIMEIKEEIVCHQSHHPVHKDLDLDLDQVQDLEVQDLTTKKTLSKYIHIKYRC